jgi:hypothetical protein
MKSLKTSIRLSLALCMGLTCHASLASPMASEDPNMTAEDRAKVIKLLNESHEQTLDLIEGSVEIQISARKMVCTRSRRAHLDG